MERNYSKLFKNLPFPEAPSGLTEGIILKLKAKERQAARIRFMLAAPIAAASCVAVFFSFRYFAQEISQSGFSDYVSVMFTDSGTVLGYWKEYVFSLAEQLPVLGATLFLGAVLVLLGSVRSVVKNARMTFTYAY